MLTIEINNANIDFARLVARAEVGEEVLILRDDKPVARIVPVREPSEYREPGRLKGRITLDETFFAPLPESELAAWAGE